MDSFPSFHRSCAILFLFVVDICTRANTFLCLLYSWSCRPWRSSHSLDARGVYVTSVLWWLRQKCTLYMADVLSSDDDDGDDDFIWGTFAIRTSGILSEFQLPLVTGVCSAVRVKRQLFTVAERTESVLCSYILPDQDGFHFAA